MVEVAATESKAPGVEVPMPILALAMKRGAETPDPPLLASVPQKSEPKVVDFTSQSAEVRFKIDRSVVEA